MTKDTKFHATTITHTMIQKIVLIQRGGIYKLNDQYPQRKEIKDKWNKPKRPTLLRDENIIEIKIDLTKRSGSTVPLAKVEYKIVYSCEKSSFGRR